MLLIDVNTYGLMFNFLNGGGEGDLEIFERVVKPTVFGVHWNEFWNCCN